MATDDRDDEKWRMGRLIEDKLEKDPLFGNSLRSVSFTRLVLHGGIWKRTFHAKVKNKKRGRAKESRSTTRFKLSDYIMREGRHEARGEELLAKGGHDPARVCELIARVKKEARNWNFSIALQFTIELPAELPLARHIEFANTVADGLEKSGRPACWAIHPPTRSKKGQRKRSDRNIHLHILAPARPVTEADGKLRVGRGKYFPDRAAVARWRAALAKTVNAQMEAEGLSHEKCARWFPGTLAQLGNNRPTKLRLSARAARRDEPDLSHPQDDYAVIWNERLEAGMDPRKDGFIRERQEELARDRIRKKLERGTKGLEMKAADSAPANSAPAAQTYKEKLAGKVLDLPPISDDERADIELAHWYLEGDLATDWEWTDVGRARARSIRDLFSKKRKESSFKYDPPRASGGKDLQGRIYLDAPEEARRNAVEMGACIDRVILAVFVPSDAPKAVLARLLKRFRRHDDVYPGRLYIDVPQGGYEEAFDLGAAFDHRTQVMYAPDHLLPAARQNLLARFAPLGAEQRPPMHYTLRQKIPPQQTGSEPEYIKMELPRLRALEPPYIAAVVRAYKTFSLDLTPGWMHSHAERAKADGVLLAAQKRWAQEEEAERRRCQEAEAASRWNAAEIQARAEARRQEEQEAERRAAEAVIRNVATDVHRSNGILRAVSSDVLHKYPEAHGRVSALSHCEAFLRGQDNQALQRIYSATLQAKRDARPQSDESDVLDGGLACLRNEAKQRNIALSDVPPPTPGGRTPPTSSGQSQRVPPPPKKNRGQER